MSLDFFTSVDVIVCLVVGALAGLLAGQYMRGGGLGLLGNMAVGIVGSVLSGFVFDWLDFMDIGDLLDPLIAGAVGAVILLAVAGMLAPQAAPRAPA